MTYIAEQNDRLDQIAYKHYKTLDFFDKVLEANSHLLDKPILEQDDKVYLPDIKIDTTEKIKKQQALW